MKNVITLLVATLSFLVTSPFTVSAQSYSIIDGDLGLYCADLPDGTNMLVNVANSGGLSTINTLDPDAEKANIVKLRRDLQKRINALTKIKKEYDPASDKAKLRKIYKFVADEIVNDLDSDDDFDNTKPGQIFKKISLLISELKNRLGDLEFALETIDRCLENEDLIPPPQSVSAEVIVFPFTHPDYGTTEWMRGLGVTAVLHKKRSSGVVCVATSKAHSTLNTFPKETALNVTRNPCLMFWQRAFRNYPFCHYGASEDSAVGWFSITSAGFSQSPVSQSDLEKLERQLANYAPIYVRAPTKKSPCRTK